MTGLLGGRRRIVPAVAVALLLSAAGCDDDPAGPVVISGTGELEGFLFFDQNRDGLFDPSDGDFAVEGVDVVVRERDTEQVFSGASATTGPAGRFEIGGLPTGTHDLFIDTTSVPDGVEFCQNPVPVTIFIGETEFEDVEGRNGCVVTIAEAEAMALGEFVTIQGIVTTFPGQIRSGYTHVEDASGAIRIFSSSLEGRGIEIGDRIEVSGTLGAFNDDLQLTGPILNSVTPDAQDPVPEVITSGELAANGAPPSNPLLGRFVRIEGAELVTGFTSGGDRNAQIDDGTGITEVRIESGVSSGTGDEILSDLGLTVGACYDITGVTGTFRGTAQLFPRSAADFEEVPCP